LTKIQETDTVVYGISKDDEESHREFQKEYQFGFSLLADTDLEVSRLYSSIREDGNMSSRTTFVIDKAGYIRSINREVNIPEHGSEVLESVQETTQYQIRAGQLAPDFVAYDENNIGYQLSAFKNKKSVVLSFYPMDMTPG
jgi:peroxiredoxin